MKIILASSSPRRQQLLTQACIEFETLAVDVDESKKSGETPEQYIFRMVADKANQALGTLLSTNAHPHSPMFIITADTIGVQGDTILGKPKDKADAFAMWRALSDKTHEVWTAVRGVLIVDGQIRLQKSAINKTVVRFLPISPQMMEFYWQMGEPWDKAGGYAIQGFGATWVQEIHGNYSNVVGLPLPLVMSFIDEAKTLLDAAMPPNAAKL